MAVLFVIAFWFTQELSFELGKLSRLSSKYHTLTNTLLEGKGYYYVDYIIVRLQLNWYWSGHADYNSYATMTPGGQGKACVHRVNNCSHVEEDLNETIIPWEYWEFNQTADWDFVQKLEFFAHNQTFYEHEFFDNSSGIRKFKLGTGVDTDVFVTIFMTDGNHGPDCINVSLTRNLIKLGDVSYNITGDGINLTLAGNGDIGDNWGLQIEILDIHDPLIFNATIVSMVGITTGAKAGEPVDPFVIPLSTEPDFTIKIRSESGKFEAYAGAEIIFIPCADRGLPNAEMHPMSGRCLISKGRGWWWWIILGAAALVLLAIIIAIIVAVICCIKRRKKPYLYVPPNTMPICPVVVMCDGNTNEDPNDHLLRNRQIELQREADVMAEQEERERIIQMVREKNTDEKNNTGGRSSPSAKISPSPTGGQSKPSGRREVNDFT